MASRSASCSGVRRFSISDRRCCKASTSRRAAFGVVQQVVLQIRIALHDPDVAQHLVQHARRAAGPALATQFLQASPRPAPRAGESRSRGRKTRCSCRVFPESARAPTPRTRRWQQLIRNGSERSSTIAVRAVRMETRLTSDKTRSPPPEVGTALRIDITAAQHFSIVTGSTSWKSLYASGSSPLCNRWSRLRVTFAFSEGNRMKLKIAAVAARQPSPCRPRPRPKSSGGIR